MLKDYFEPFMLLRLRGVPDGAGGQHRVLTDDVPFLAGITQTAGRSEEIAGQSALHATPVLLHELDVTLEYGDIVRRERDGALYRVTGRTRDMMTPAFSGLQYAQVPVERLAIAC